MSRPTKSRDGHLVRRSAALTALLVLVMLTTQAAAQTYPRGFVPPPDYEEQLEAHRVVLPMDKDPLPAYFDWRNSGGVTPPKNQGDCGSCWAFAATGEMEAKIKIYYGVELNLSEQQIVSCNPYGAGCSGGWAGSAYYVFMHYGGVLENCMPYLGSDNVPCVQDDYLKFTDMDTWVSIANDTDQIKRAIQDGPVCTAVDANSAWDGYTGGVIDAPGSGTNHLVLIVGWVDSMGDHGAWIVKNSWGMGWGDGGYCYVAYGACNIGSGVTTMTYTPPPVEVDVTSPVGDQVYNADEPVEIAWQTSGDETSTVDIYFGTIGACQDQVIAENVPNTGSYEWIVANQTTDRGTVLVFPSEGTYRGFGFCAGEFEILGHQTRYVSAAGSNTPPFDSPGDAAHSVREAVLAGAGRDTVLIAGGDYIEDRVGINGPLHLMGGWNADFSVHDPATNETRLRGVNGTLSFNADAGDHCGVSHVTFHDCQGWNMADPVAGRHGGAVIAMGASPLVEHCVFVDNLANPTTGIGWGGSILAHTGAPVVRDCTFTGSVGSHGGAIALSQCTDALIEDCEFLANATSDSSSSQPGAAIYVTGGSAILRDCELRDGGAGVGGGLAVAGGAAVVAERMTFSGNRAVTSGGAIFVDGADLELVASEVVGNRSWTGRAGGIFARNGGLQLVNVLLGENVAAGIGGGLYVESPTGGGVQHSLAHANEGSLVGGMFVTAEVAFPVVDNILLANLGGGLMASGTGITSDCNVAYANVGGDFLAATGMGDLVQDPLLVDAAGGDYAPALHSPLVDTGSGLAGVDWDGGAADRGLHGGPQAIPVGPARVGDLQGSVAAGVVSLQWEAVADAAMYVVYRDTVATFMPSAATVCATLDGETLVCQDTPPTGDWYYVVAACDAAGHMGGLSERFETDGSTVPVADDQTPRTLAVTGLAPNPFNPRTVMSFDVPAAGPVRLQVYDMRGRLVAVLQDGPLPAGHHEAVWTGRDRQGRAAAAGVYLVRLDDGRGVATRKAVLAK